MWFNVLAFLVAMAGFGLAVLWEDNCGLRYNDPDKLKVHFVIWVVAVGLEWWIRASLLAWVQAVLIILAACALALLWFVFCDITTAPPCIFGGGWVAIGLCGLSLVGSALSGHAAPVLRSDLCSMVKSAESSLGWDSFKDAGSVLAPMIAEQLIVASFPVTVPQVTFGVAGLLWVTNFGFVRYGLPRMCRQHPDRNFSVPNMSLSMLAHIYDSAGLDNGGLKTLFTSKTPINSSGRSCVLFPDENANMTPKFCSQFGLSHPVVDLFLDDNFAQLRDKEAMIFWDNMARLMEEYKIVKVVESGPATLASVCRYAVGAAMCLDAFPPCDRRVLTPCSMACINLRLCFAGVMGVSWGAYQEDFLQHLNKVEKFCVRLCNTSSLHTMDEPVPVRPLQEEFLGGPLLLSTRLAAEQSVPTVPLKFPLAVGAVAFAFAVARLWRQGRVPKDEGDAYYLVII